MPPAHLWFSFLIAGLVLCLIPGPSLLFTIGRALAEGRRTALLSVLGNGLGILTQILAIAVGLGPLVARSGALYTTLKLAGAAYLVYLGVQTIRHRRDAESALAILDAPRRPAHHAVRDGFVVGVTNPKTIVFFIALLPSFVDPAGAPVPLQMAVLGVTFFLIGITCDGLVATAAGTARQWFARQPNRMRQLSAAGGVMMIGLALALALTGRPGEAHAR
ncbi:MAG: LysE family translocator [Actinobacteria bacterium]|nr:LysE family translocator [Actinomycetota bacterium]